MSTIAEQTRLKCPSCKASIRVDLGNRRKKMQCPRCLNAIPVERPVTLAPDVDPLRIAELESDIEILRTENAMLRARVEGLQAEKNARETELSPGRVEVESQLIALTAEITAVRVQLKNAESALRESSNLITYLASMDSRINILGTNYVRAIVRITELEKK